MVYVFLYIYLYIRWQEQRERWVEEVAGREDEQTTFVRPRATSTLLVRNVWLVANVKVSPHRRHPALKASLRRGRHTRSLAQRASTRRPFCVFIPSRPPQPPRNSVHHIRIDHRAFAPACRRSTYAQRFKCICNPRPPPVTYATHTII